MDKQYKCWSLYCHTNKTNGKKYIGITSKYPKYRWGKNGKNYEDQPQFYRAIKKYGWDNFDHEVIMSNLTAEEAGDYEKCYIEFFNTKVPNGYNISDGGLTPHRSGKTIYRYDLDGNYIDSFKSINSVVQHGFNIGDVQRVLKDKKSHYHNGFLWYDEYFENVEPYDKEKWHSHRKKCVYQYDEFGNFIKEFNDVESASIEIGTTKDAIYQSCNNYYKTKNYIFSYDFVESIDISLYKGKTYNKKPVAKTDMCGNILEIYDSISEATRLNNLPRVAIGRVLSGKQKQTHGFYWKYI